MHSHILVIVLWPPHITFLLFVKTTTQKMRILLRCMFYIEASIYFLYAFVWWLSIERWLTWTSYFLIKSFQVNKMLSLSLWERERERERLLLLLLRRAIFSLNILSKQMLLYIINDVRSEKTIQISLSLSFLIACRQGINLIFFKWYNPLLQ